MIPCSHNHITKLGVWCPLKLSSTSNRRSGGMPSLLRGAMCKPSCHRCHWAWVSSGLSSGGAGSRARIWVNSCCTHSCKTALGQAVTPLTRTFPVAGWNKVSSLAVPFLAYLWGCLRGSPVFLPRVPRRGNGLIGTRFILRPDVQPLLLGWGIGLLDEVFPRRISIGDLDHPAFSRAGRLARVTPCACFLPTVA